MLKALLLSLTVLSANALASECDDFTNVEMKKLRSDKTINLCQFKDKPLLIINTASNCGFTSQFKGLEAIHKKYKDQGLVVLGFPSDDFFQEEDDETDTAKVCFINYGVTFNMFAPISVRGKNADPIFKHLAEQTSSPKWNFYKYIVSKDRKTVLKFNSKTTPEDADFIKAIEESL